MGKRASGKPTSLGLRRRRGNALAEFAIVWFPLFALLFGIADVTRLIFMRNMMQNGVREAVRYAITYQLNFDNSGCASMTGCIKAAVQKNTLGFLKGTVAGQPAESYIKVYYYAPDRLSEPLAQADLPRNVNGVQIDYVNQPGNLIEVRVENYPVNWLVPLPVNYLKGTGLVLNVSSSDVLQGLPASQQVPPAP